jgi:hypothetical protein
MTSWLFVLSVVGVEFVREVSLEMCYVSTWKNYE